MLKKLAPFLYCLTPLGALANQIQIPGTPGEVYEYTGNLIVSASDSYELMSGAGIYATGGISTVDGLYIGFTPTTPNLGAIYAYAESEPDMNFSVTAGDDISIETVLQVFENRTLTIGGENSAIDITTGAVEAVGGLTVSNADVLSFAQLVGSGTGSVDITGSSLTIRTGDFQSLGSKDVTVNVGTGAFSVANGAIENKSSGDMTITAGTITAQTITNEVTGESTGDLTINATSLMLTGGDATDNASFVNKGNFLGIVSGATQLEHGFDLSTMGATNTFNLTTGTLSLGDRIGSFYTNNLNSFVLNVTDETYGTIDAGTYAIRNGVLVGETQNLEAGMTLTAYGVSAAGIENLATLNITSYGVVTMTGDITNSGALDVSGTTFSLTNVNNSGAATLNGSGAFSANAISNLTTAESLSISGSTITTTGLITNDAGVMSIESDGAVSALGLVANAGTMNISGTVLNIGTSGIDVGANGALNISGATDITSGGEISVANNLTVGAGTAGAGDIAISDGVVDITINSDKLNVLANVSANGSGNGINIDAQTMEIGGNVSATNSGAIELGVANASGYALTVDGGVSATSGGKIYLYTDNALISNAITENGGLILTDDTNITTGSVSIQDGLWFDENAHTNGFVIDSVDAFTLNVALATINGGGNIASGNTLNILRFGGEQSSVTMAGNFANSGTVNIGASDSAFGAVTLGTLENNGNFNVWTSQIGGGNITNNADANLNLVSMGNVTLSGLTNSGAADISGAVVSLGAVQANSGNATGGGLRVDATTSFAANSLNITGGAGAMDIDAPVINITGAVNTNDGVLHQGSGSASSLNLLADEFTFDAGSIDIESFVADGGIGTYSISGTADFGTGIFVANGALVNFERDDIDAPTFSAAGALVQNASGLSADGTVNIISDEFILNANVVSVGDDINVNNFAISNLDATDGVNITVGGDVSGGLDIIGLDYMTVGGDYIFDDNSRLLAIANSSSTHDYWTDVDFSGETPVVNELTGGETALITVNGSLISETSGLNMTANPADLADSQFGIVLKQAVTESSALWLANAADIQGTFSQLSVGFCNADGTNCVNYLDAFSSFNSTDDDLPVYLITQGNSLYVVFDTRFGTPMGLYKLQPVVEATDGHTTGEWQSAGALDNLIEAQLEGLGFEYETAVLPVVQILFNDTPLENVGQELYARMNDYSQNGNGNVIRAFSRLFQLREANQIADSLSMNTHMNFRDMSDRFIDEAIWNRNRRLNKLWIDGDYTLFRNDFEDIRGDGDRFGLALGYDWQTTNTLILGWMVHASYTNANVSDDIDLSYTDSGAIAGHVESDVTNLNVGGGLYFLDTLSNKARLYGDLMVDVNMIDVERNQTWVDKITGDATSFGVIAELGLIHDWLNQYIIGNLYVRGGYNFGFDMTEKVGGTKYMNLDFDGHPILTPGYSLTAQKRVYPSVWFEFRPYITAGIEYDLLGTPDTMKYKFALANKWTEYDIDIDPLWANAGAGVEFLWVNGLHIGLGYRYQYNQDIQAHKIHGSIKYRF